MTRDSLSKQVADELTQAIIAGEFEAGSLLPSEPELATRFDVSRLTIREAVKILRAANLVVVQGGRGTTINPISAWTDLGLLVQAELANPDAADGDESVPHRLIEARRLIETGSARLAAERRTEDDLEALERYQLELEEATRVEDLEGFVKADLAFHRRVMEATGNPFIHVLFDPLHRALEEGRRQTSAVQEIREHAVLHHRAVLDAITAGDPELADLRMAEHMEQTREDLDAYILQLEASPTEGGRAA